MFFVIPVYSVIFFIMLILFSWNVEDKRQMLIVIIVVVVYLMARRISSPLVGCSGALFGMLGLL
ncbi:MAG: hypothetical protein HFG54_01405 [Lachnospiraceae bacterium]|jgi:hypothetical protein|nr:hypothetical protein [Lachnospiraceae bacterium]